MYGNNEFDQAGVILTDGTNRGKIVASSSFAWIYDCENTHNFDTCGDFYPWGPFYEINRDLNPQALHESFSWLVDEDKFLMHTPSLTVNSTMNFIVTMVH